MLVTCRMCVLKSLRIVDILWPLHLEVLPHWTQFEGDEHLILNLATSFFKGHRNLVLNEKGPQTVSHGGWSSLWWWVNRYVFVVLVDSPWAWWRALVFGVCFGQRAFWFPPKVRIYLIYVESNLLIQGWWTLDLELDLWFLEGSSRIDLEWNETTKSFTWRVVFGFNVDGPAHVFVCLVFSPWAWWRTRVWALKHGSWTCGLKPPSK